MDTHLCLSSHVIHSILLLSRVCGLGHETWYERGEGAAIGGRLRGSRPTATIR